MWVPRWAPTRCTGSSRVAKITPWPPPSRSRPRSPRAGTPSARSPGAARSPWTARPTRHPPAGNTGADAARARLAGVEIRTVAYDHPDACLLIDEVQQEYVVRYGGVDGTLVDPAEFSPPTGLFLVGYLDGDPVTCG